MAGKDGHGLLLNLESQEYTACNITKQASLFFRASDFADDLVDSTPSVGGVPELQSFCFVISHLRYTCPSFHSKGEHMPHYVSLLHLTHKGVENIKDSPKRIDAAKKAIESVGGKLKSFYFTMGQYDAVTIAEFPSDEAASRLALASAAQGNVRTETLRAFTEEEYRKIIASLP